MFLGEVAEPQERVGVVLEDQRYCADQPLGEVDRSNEGMPGIADEVLVDHSEGAEQPGRVSAFDGHLGGGVVRVEGAARGLVTGGEEGDGHGDST